jgi:hypothetical protein
LPRTITPPNPVTSTTCVSRLAIASTERSGLPLDTPSVVLPVGTLAIARMANPSGRPSASDARLIFAPMDTSPAGTERNALRASG